MTQLSRVKLEELQRRNYSEITTRKYLQIVTNFAQHFGKSPDKLGPGQLRTYQAYLLKEHKLAVHRPVDLQSVLPRQVSKAGRSTAGGPRNHTTLSAL